jgi:predicted permease
LKYAARSLAARPLLLTAAVTSIAIGVSANLTIFALGSQLLLAVPSASRPSQLLHIRTGNGSHVSFPAWRGFDASGALAGVAGYNLLADVNWRGPVETVGITALAVTSNYFDVVGVPVARGRGFTGDEARLERDPRLVVVSHGFWQGRLGGAADAVGSRLVLNGQPYDVIGILPADVRSLPGYGLTPDLYVAANRSLMPRVDNPRATTVMLIGRRKDGQSVAEARSALMVVAGRLGHEFRDDELKWITDVSPLGGLLQAKDFRAVAAFFGVLMLVAGLVLAIACANVAGLLLARGTARRRELAMRVALGASRRRLVQQLLVEGFVLAAGGAALGFALTTIAGRVLSTISLPLPVPIAVGLTYDGRLLALALGLVAASTLLCSLLPALKATRVSLIPALKQEEAHFVQRRFTMRNVLLVGQVAVSLVLLITSAMFLRNLARATSLDPGFDVEPVLVAQITFVQGRQGTPAEPAAGRLVERLRGLPGVSAAAFTDGVPLTLFFGDGVGNELSIDGRSERVFAEYTRNRVGPGYFEVLGIDLVAGRAFAPGDRVGAPGVVIVNEEFVRRYFDGRMPLGRRIAEGDREAMEVIGVVADSRYRSIGEAPSPALYLSYAQQPELSRRTHLLVRGAGDAASLTSLVGDTIRRDDDSAAATVEPMSSALDFAFLPSRIGAALLGALGAVGTLLTMIGLFGVVSFMVSRRTSELGVRMALGATRAQVLWLVLRDGGLLVALGLALGLGTALIVTQPLAAFLVAGLSPTDPITVGSTVLLLVATSVAAMWNPAVRATRIEPTQALRAE